VSEAKPPAWEALIAFLVRRRAWALALMLALSLLAAPAALDVKFSSDPTDVFPREDPVVRAWLELTRRSGALDVLMVGLEEPEQALSPEGLERLSRITDRLVRLKAEGVLLARSLANVPSVRESQDGSLDQDLLMPAPPQDQAQREALAERIRGDAQVLGSLVSADLKGYLVLVRADTRHDARDIAARVREVVEVERGPLTAYYFGAPMVTLSITSRTFAMLPWLAPLFVLAALLAGWLFLRRLGPLLVVLLAAAWSLLWWLGLAWTVGLTFSSTSINAALLLTVVAGLAYARAVQGWVEPAGDAPRLFPIWLASLLVVLALALAGLTLVPLELLSRFGQAAALGVVAVLLFGLLGLVPLASFLAPRRPAPEATPSRPLRLTPARARWLLVGLALVGAAGASRTRFFFEPRDLFSAGDEMGRGVAFMDSHFGGSDFLQIGVRADLREPGNAARLERLTCLLEGSGAFTDVRSVTQVLGFLAEVFNGQHRIPSHRAGLDNLWFFLEGNEDVRMLASSDRDEAMVAARVPPGKGELRTAWIEAAQAAVERSAVAGYEGALYCLTGLARRYQVTLAPGALRGTLETASRGLVGPFEVAVRSGVRRSLQQYLASEDSPIHVTDLEWEGLAAILDSPPGAERRDRLVAAIAGLHDFAEQELPPDVARELADTLLTRQSARSVELRLDVLALQLLEGTPRDQVPSAFVKRAKGVLADLLDPAPPEKGFSAQVSGLPVAAPAVEANLLQGLGLAGALLVLALALLGALALRRARAVLELGLPAAVATLATLGAGWALGVHADPSSVVLYLVPPLAAALLAAVPNAASPAGQPSPGGAQPNGRGLSGGLALAIAAGPATLLLTGILPVMRLGAVLSLGVIAATTAASLAWRARRS
jgi:predicted RND superfamily exporter protein